MRILHLLSLVAIWMSALVTPVAASSESNCAVELMILGIAQDAGAPQIGNSSDPAWVDPSLKRHATSLALIDHQAGKRFLFEATPDIKEQLHMLEMQFPQQPDAQVFDGIFLTHAHIGHYAGLMMLGHEAMGAKNIPVFVMPRMHEFLSTNGPWDQLVNYQNIKLKPLQASVATKLTDHIKVIPFQVPHRDEYSETVGYLIKTKSKSAFFVPDIDDWDRWREEHEMDIRDMVQSVDYAFVDATFYDDHELPGRDMSKIPHPRVTDTMARFEEASDEIKSRIRFIHMNHTNQARFPDSANHRAVKAAGFGIAEEGETYCLQ